jgi:hypothetical protein
MQVRFFFCGGVVFFGDMFIPTFWRDIIGNYSFVLYVSFDVLHCKK